MEQNRLGMQDMLHHEHQSLHDQHFSSTNLRAPKICLRSMSKSDPHLNIPHLMMSQDEDHPSLNKIVSGLFHADTVLSAVPHLHVENASMSAGHSNHALKPCESSATLLRDPTSTTPSLRKSSSAVGWSFADKNQVSSQELSPWSSPENNIKSSTTAFLPGLALNQVSDHSQGGLVMSSTPDNKMSVLVPAAPTSSFSQSLSAAASASVSAAAVNPLEPQVASHDRKSYGMFGNMFRQGFFSRPVVRSDEEQYRYIMALDR